MLPIDEIRDALISFVPTLAVVAVLAVLLWLAHRLLLGRHPALGAGDRLPRQLALVFLGLLAFLAGLLALPLEADSRQQLLQLVGLVLTAAIALSSTTFVANAMAGLMLRLIRGFGPGDFVRVADHFGRVTERGLFHTEIQTEDRDLTTLPNLFLISQPISVVRASGTIVSAEVSLGYDVDHGDAEDQLLAAARDAGLEEPFVQIRSLGDFSVVYRIAGFLADVKSLLPARSRLRREMIDRLHGAGIEIVSPNYMNQRPIDPEAPVMPKSPRRTRHRIADGQGNARVFDKAERAEALAAIRAELAANQEALQQLDAELAEAEDGRRDAIALERARLQTACRAIEEQIAELESAVEAEDA